MAGTGRRDDVTLIAWAGGVVLLGALVLATVARRRIWGFRLAAATAARDRPAGTVLLAARSIRGAKMEVTPLLADWQARGVLDVARRGPDLTADRRTGAASGPEWQFTVLDASRVDAVELPVLQAFVPAAPARGATALLTREDTATRDAIASAISTAIARQRTTFGPQPLEAPAVAVALVAFAVVGGTAALVGTVVSAAGPVAIAFAFLGAVAGISLVVILCGRARRPSDAERQYRQAVRDLEAWVRSTDDPDPALAGWAMLWDLPGAWQSQMPTPITALRLRDRAFLRGDFAKEIATSTSI